MPVDYNLVILGGSQAARDAAIASRALHARVALVEPHPPMLPWLPRPVTAANGTPEVVLPRHLNAMGQPPTLTELAAAGVDVIPQQGEFEGHPRLTIRVPQRHLRSRAFLLVPKPEPVIPALPGLQSIPYLTPTSLESADALAHPPKRLVILGGTSTALQFAQVFCRLGSEVTLITGDRLLPQADPEAAMRIQAQLEAEGVCIWSHTPVLTIQSSQGKPMVTTPITTHTADQLLVTSGWQPSPAALAALKLDALGIHPHRYGIPVNAYLQTSHPHLYVANSTAFPHLARQEVAIALTNALGWRRQAIHYPHLPKIMWTDPPLAQVGLTEPQARQRYGAEVIVQTRSITPQAMPHLAGHPTGLCKVITRSNGQLLGAHWVGPNAEETIALAAYALQLHRPIQTLAHLPTASPTMSDGLWQVAMDWQQRHWRQPRLQTWLELWFEFQRDRP